MLSGLGINASLILAQAINFVVLLFILKKYLYKPLIKKVEDDESELLAIKSKNDELTNKLALAQSEAKNLIKNAQLKAQRVILDADSISKIYRISSNPEIAKIITDGFFQKLTKEARATLPKYPDTSSFILEYTSITSDQTEEIKNFIKRTFGAKAKLSLKQNLSLILGFRLTTEDKIIEENLFSEINNAKS